MYEREVAMSSSSDNENTFIVIAVILLGILALGVWQFSGAINVNFATGLSVLLRAGGVIALSIAFMKFDILSLSAVIPGLLGGLAWAFFPALDYWALQSVDSVQLGLELSTPVWYVRWYSKVAFVLVPGLGGYGVRSVAISR
jgi:hypothetical protein